MSEQKLSYTASSSGDGFDEAFVGSSRGSSPVEAARQVREHYHEIMEGLDEDDADLSIYADHDEMDPDALQGLQVHYEAPGDHVARGMISGAGGLVPSVLAGNDGGGVGANEVGHGGAPTRTAETEKNYMKRAQSLLRQCAETLAGDRGRFDQIEPMQFVIWAIERREEISKSSWRQYKAAIRYWLNTVGTADARKAALLLESKNSSVCLDKTERTSGRRRKSYDHQLFHDFLDHIVVVAPRTPFSRYAGILRTWLMLGYLTGLRPHEWCHSEVIRVPVDVDRLPVTADRGHLNRLPGAGLGGLSGFEDLGFLPSDEMGDLERNAGVLDARSGLGHLDEFLDGQEDPGDWADGEDAFFEDIPHEDLDADSDEEILAILHGSPIPSRTQDALSSTDARGQKDHDALDFSLDARSKNGYPDFLLSGRTYLKVRNSKNTNGRAHGVYRHLDVTDFGGRVLVALDAFVCYMSKLTRVRYKSTYDDCRLLLNAVNESFFKEGEKYIQLYSARHFYASNAKKHMAPTDVAAAMGHANDQTAYSFYGNARYGSGGLMARPISEEAQRVRQVRKIPDFIQGDVATASPSLSHEGVGDD